MGACSCGCLVVLCPSPCPEHPTKPCFWVGVVCYCVFPLGQGLPAHWTYHLISEAGNNIPLVYR